MHLGTSTGLLNMASYKAVASLVVIAMWMHLATGGRSSEQGDQDAKETMWPGHLEPLGSKAVKKQIPTLEGFPSPKTFFVDHVLGSLPVVFRNGARLSPAIKLWTDKHLSLRPEAQTYKVDVEVRKKEDRRQPTLRMTFAEFLKRYKQKDEYMVETLPNFLREDVLVPPPLVCDDVLKRISDVVMWFSSGGTKSVMHQDDTDNINCLFSGQKEILFINYTQYRQQVPLDHPEGSYSSLDVDSVDMEQYPGMRDVEFYQAKMFPGDCIYIPYKWIHQVNSHGRNIAVNVWFEHSCETVPSPEVCGPTDRRLTIADVQLGVEKPLDFEEDFEETRPSSYEDFIKSLQKNNATWTEFDLIAFMKMEVPMFNDLEWTEECDDLVHEVFEMLDMDDDHVVDQTDLKRATEADDTYHFQVEGKLLILGDIEHEQKTALRLQAYEAEKKRNEKTLKKEGEEPPNVHIEYVEPLNLDDIDWGLTEEQYKEAKTNQIPEKEKKRAERKLKAQKKIERKQVPKKEKVENGDSDVKLEL